MGSASSAAYLVKMYDTTILHDKYQENDQIQDEAYTILNTSKSNLFGGY